MPDLPYPIRLALALSSAVLVVFLVALLQVALMACIQSLLAILSPETHP